MIQFHAYQFPAVSYWIVSLQGVRALIIWLSSATCKVHNKKINTTIQFMVSKMFLFLIKEIFSKIYYYDYIKQNIINIML